MDGGLNSPPGLRMYVRVRACMCISRHEPFHHSKHRVIIVNNKTKSIVESSNIQTKDQLQLYNSRV